MTPQSDDFAAVDAYIASLEDASGMPELIAQTFNVCLDCNASGYASKYDGVSLGVCPTCNGHGSAS